MSNAEAFHAKRNFAAGVSNTDRLAIGEGMTDQEQHCLHQSNRNLFRSISSRSEEHTSELQSLMRISYAVFCLKKKKNQKQKTVNKTQKKNTPTTHNYAETSIHYSTDLKH